MRTTFAQEVLAPERDPIWSPNTSSRNAPTPLSRKLAVISETAKILTDIINTKRSLRLEVIIVVLIAFEIIIMAYQIMMR